MSAPAPSELTDAELSARITSGGAGGAGAEAELCRRFERRVRLYGHRHLRDPQLAEDLAQRVLEIVLDKLRTGALREPERIASFVLGVARMEAHAMRRRGHREEPVAEAPAPSEVRVHEPELLGRDRLEQCLHALPERERTVLLLAYFQEQTAPEIGDSLGLSAGNVRVIRHRAIERLRVCMGLSGEES